MDVARSRYSRSRLRYATMGTQVTAAEIESADLVVAIEDSQCAGLGLATDPRKVSC